MSSSAPDGLQPITAVLSAVLLGRIQVGVTRAPADVLRIFAATLVRESLITALRQEGHEFTEQRFFAWFAGLTTLSDPSQAVLRPPKALCQAILTEFCHSPWPELVGASQDLLRSFLAPADISRGHDHTEAHTIIAEAHSLLAGLPAVDDGLPFRSARMLFAAAAQTARFAREDRSLDLIAGAAIEREFIGNARWALDILAGQLLAPRHGLPVALPIPGLIALPMSQSDPIEPIPSEPHVRDDVVFSALHEGFSRLDRWLSEAQLAAEHIRAQLHDRRRGGRSLQLAEYLAGFGPMRSRQIEQLLGASRNGVAVIITALETSLLLVSHKSRNATQMYAYTPALAASAPDAAHTAPFASSASAIAEYDEAMRAIDELLKRASTSPDSD
ncbi:hypothetical protein WBP07_26290 [Novosphingobium sp. BL-8A]|uniref:hypothetical protein n=1 Tax=Novosphingobium sp. BL-8A TaxID=3127639 RepID=UPI0037565DD2